MKWESQALSIPHWKGGRDGEEGSRPRRARHILDCSKLEVLTTLREVGEAGEGRTNIYGALAVCLVPSSRSGPLQALGGVSCRQVCAGRGSERTEGGKVAGREARLPPPPAPTRPSWCSCVLSICLVVGFGFRLPGRGQPSVRCHGERCDVAARGVAMTMACWNTKRCGELGTAPAPHPVPSHCILSELSRETDATHKSHRCPSSGSRDGRGGAARVPF